MTMRQQRIEHIAKHQRNPVKSKKERLAFLFREVKRRLIKDGKIDDPSKRPPKYQYHWTVGDRDQGGIVVANTMGEARGLIKKQIGIKRGRLPQCIKIVRIINDSSSSPSDVPFSIEQVPSGDSLDNVGNADGSV